MEAHGEVFMLGPTLVDGKHRALDAHVGHPGKGRALQKCASIIGEDSKAHLNIGLICVSEDALFDGKAVTCIGDVNIINLWVAKGFFKRTNGAESSFPKKFIRHFVGGALAERVVLLKIAWGCWLAFQEQKKIILKLGRIKNSLLVDGDALRVACGTL